MPTNTQFVNNLEYNQDKIVAGYRQHFEKEFGKSADIYGPLTFKIVNKYSKTRIPGVELGDVVGFSYERAIFYADLAGGWQEHYKTFNPITSKRRYNVISQTKHFVTVKTNNEHGEFQIVHTHSGWPIVAWTKSLECANAIMAAMEEFGSHWNFTSASNFNNNVPDDVKTNMLNTIKRILNEYGE